MKKLLIVGAGGHGREILDLARALESTQNKWKIFGFLDDAVRDAKISGIPLVGPLRGHEIGSDYCYALGIGDSQTRARIGQSILGRGGELCTLVHPSCVVSPQSTIEKGVMVLPFCFVSHQVILRVGSLLNAGCSVSHDTEIGEYTTLSPGVSIAGGASIGHQVFFGIGSKVAPRIRIGNQCVVGGNSMVLHNLSGSTFAAGSPAKPKSRGSQT